MRIAAACVVLALTLAFPAGAGAQQSIQAQVVKEGEVPFTSPWLFFLRQEYTRGNTSELVKLAKEFLADLALEKFHASCCDFDRRYYELVFTAFDAAGTETLVRLLVHEPDLEQAILPGLKGESDPLYIVFLAEDDSVTLRASYDLEREENPLLKESGDFVALVLGKFALPTATAMSNAMTNAKTAAAAAATPIPARVTLMKAVFPYGRGKLTARHTLEIVDPVMHVKAQASTLTGVLRDPTQNPKPPDACLKMAEDLGTAVTKTADAACTYAQLDMKLSCWDALKDAIAKAYSAAMQTAACDGRLALALGRAYGPLATAPPRRLATTATMSNTPLRWASFSLATTVISGIDPDEDEPRAKVANSGLIIADTFTRFLPLGLFNVMPWKYDGKAVSPDWHEKARFSVGVGLTPYLAMSAGGGWNFSRYLGITFARAQIWYDTPKAGRAGLDKAPSDAEKVVPMRLGSTGVWVVGLSYSVR